MDKCWEIELDNSDINQSNNQLSFIGGQPRIPIDFPLPHCELCAQEQSFFLQIAFPDADKWEGLSLAIFSCTSCVDEDHLIPEMITDLSPGTSISGDFLERYQKNFRFVVFNQKYSVRRSDYSARVKYRPIILCEAPANKLSSKIRGIPNWLLGDESPGKLDGLHNMKFLLQIVPGFKFKLIEGAPHQMELNLAGLPEVSSNSYYELFNGNAIYFFGAENKESSLVYAITQI